VDFPAVLAALVDHHYRGFLTIERDGATDPFSEFGNAVKFLKNVQMG
jgi:sugar phosphate isomerase/epimerase